MHNNELKHGQTMVGERMIPFEKITLLDRYQMYVPESFSHDDSLTWRYACLHNDSKSPLSLVIRFAEQHEVAAREKLEESFFGNDKITETITGAHFSTIRCSERSIPGKSMDIYIVRFVVETTDDVLLGCFTCASQFKDHWKPALLKMLACIEPLRQAA